MGTRTYASQSRSAAAIYSCANHLAFDIAPELFEQAVAVLRSHQVQIEGELVTRPTGRGVYFYDPDGFLIEIRCDPK